MSLHDVSMRAGLVARSGRCCCSDVQAHAQPSSFRPCQIIVVLCFVSSISSPGTNAIELAQPLPDALLIHNANRTLYLRVCQHRWFESEPLYGYPLLLENRVV
jgi:hypothetical protein